MERRQPRQKGAKPDPLATEIEALRPYLELAREIRDEVDRIAADGTARPESLVAAIDAIPQRERGRVARSIFAQLPPEQQWTTLERIFGDDELRGYLTADRDSLLDAARRASQRSEVIRASRTAGCLDLLALPADREVTLGLFRSAEVRAAVVRGRTSDTCARQLTLRTTEVPGELHVISDDFNPRRGLFVTADYDERVWAAERLPIHSLVHVGSLRRDDTDPDLTPMLYPGGRVDFLVGGEPREGRLHLGFALLDDEDVFSSAS